MNDRIRNKPKSIREISKLLDDIFARRPNVYKFLVERGVSEDIASDAQELIMEHYTEAWVDLQHDIAKELHSSIHKLEKTVDVICEKLWEKPNAILEAMEDL